MEKILPEKPELFQFAYFQNYQNSINELAALTPGEEWDFHAAGKKKKAILKNYLEYTYKKVKEETKISFTAENKNACFNTGLVTPQLEEIYTLFEKNNLQGESMSQFFFKGFVKESDRTFLRLFARNRPERADFFQKPEDLIFNPNCDIIPDLDHIITDNKERFPAYMQPMGDDGIRRQLIGAIDEVKKKVKTNYKIAVPQYYRNRIQLLLPLCLTAGSPNPDLALVIYKVDEMTYCARTCLTIQMAYTNARLIVRPQSDWLKP